ncbi:MAG: DNA-binding protein [Candidatus Kapaibacterium sp.]|nr:MAG: DNA-binding protein [Candidatus Kapabacteria bacterium]
MTSIRVEPNLQVLAWAVKRAGAHLQRKFPRLDRWLSGAEKPTLRQLEAFARAASVPFGYLFLSEPPEERLPMPHFRTVEGMPAESPSPDLLETVYIMQRRQAWMREYLIEQGHEALPFVGSVNVDSDPQEVSLQMRKVLGLNVEWAANLRRWTDALRFLQERAEAAGILVVTSSVVGNNTRRKLSVEEFRGFVLVDEYAPLVFINGADGKAAQMFTLAHELAHVWLGESAAFDLRNLQPATDKLEEACNRIAAEFLVPEDSLRTFWTEARRQSDSFQAIARRFKVSEIVAARRALDLQLITREDFFAFYEAYQRGEGKAPASGEEGGNFYATQTMRLGRRFAKTVIQAVREGALLYHEAYRLTGLYGRTFERFKEHLIGGLP